MYLRLLFLLITLLVITSCDDGSCELELNVPVISGSTTVYDQNVADIKAYLLANGLTAQETASGLHYIIDEAGSEAKPTLCDEVDVTYDGYLLDGTPFDDGTISFGLTNVILGWQEGIPLFGKGGKGRLLIPSYLAYGPTGSGSVIGPNAVLVFDVTLNDF